MNDKVFPLVSIITVNFNQSKVTSELLDSLRVVTYPNLEIIVVDNGSLREPTDSIKDLYPEVIFLKSQHNLGFAGGNNLGVKIATGEFLLFLNNDTEVEPGFLEPLVARLLSDHSIGMVSPKIRFHHTPDTIQYAGYTPLNRTTLRQHLIGYKEKDFGQYNTAQLTFSIHGAAMMVPRFVVERVGLMAEMYFLYYEEHDWAERIKEAGFSIFYEPASVVLHKESISTGKESPLKTYYINRNRFLFARRNIKGGHRLLTLMYLSFIAFPKGLISHLVDGRPDLAKCVWSAYFWNFLKFRHIRNNQYLD
jgi:GT2 family glycosyltransferase